MVYPYGSIGWESRPSPKHQKERGKPRSGVCHRIACVNQRRQVLGQSGLILLLQGTQHAEGVLLNLSVWPLLCGW